MLQLLRLVRVKTGYNTVKNVHYYKTYGVYKCCCGNEVQVIPSVGKNRKSCGCLFGGKTHGLSNGRHSLYHVWVGMKQRCYNPKSKRYHRYGKRGIKVCDEWRYSFVNFYEWSTHNGWKPGSTIERINNDNGYNPSNCCFIPLRRQARNRATTKLTINQVREIRACYDSGLETNAELARRYKITATTMCKIVHRKIWKEY